MSHLMSPEEIQFRLQLAAQQRQTATGQMLARERARQVEENYWRRYVDGQLQQNSQAPTLPDDFPVKFIPTNSSFTEFHSQMERKRQEGEKSNYKYKLYWVFGFIIGCLIYELLKRLMF